LCGVVAPDNTALGTSVAVPGPIAPSGAEASVQFGQVTTAGATQMTLTSMSFASGSSLSAASGSTALSVSTTASFSGGATVCVPTAGSNPPPTVYQCDRGSCPGSDPRLTTAVADAQGDAYCCGNVSAGVAAANPMCVSTQGLSPAHSVFVVQQNTVSTPALGSYVGWLLALLAVGGSGLSMRKRAAA
jgi:hypothetical protein